MNKRITYIDSLKGFAIFLVVFGHVLQGKVFPTAIPLHELIYSFHMPLFMFLSGLFAYKAEEAVEKGAAITFLKKKMLLLIVPCMIWSILMCIYKKENFFYDVILKGGFHYWFLFLLFIFFAIIIAVSMVKTNKKIKLILFLLPWLTIYFLSSDTIVAEVFNKNRFLHNYPFFIMAYYARKNNKIMNILSSWKSGIPCIIIFIIGYKYLITTFLLGGGILAVLAIIGLLFLFKNIMSLGENPILRKWGNMTLEIYLVHYFLTGLIPNTLTYLMGRSIFTIASAQCLFICIVCSIAIIQICTYFYTVINKKQILRKVLFGR